MKRKDCTPTMQEALHITRACFPVGAFPLIRELCERFNCQCENSSSERALRYMLAAAYTAGHVAGIREERQRRKANAPAGAANRQEEHT